MLGTIGHFGLGRRPGLAIAAVLAAAASLGSAVNSASLRPEPRARAGRPGDRKRRRLVRARAYDHEHYAGVKLTRKAAKGQLGTGHPR